MWITFDLQRAFFPLEADISFFFGKFTVEVWQVFFWKLMLKHDSYDKTHETICANDIHESNSKPGDEMLNCIYRLPVFVDSYLY